MHILHAHHEIFASRDDIVPALAGLLPALREQGVETDLVSLTSGRQSACSSPVHGPHLHLAHAIEVDPIFGYSWELRPLMELLSSESSVIHSHGLWFYTNYMAYRVARENNKPHIITLHGTLAPSVQSRPRWYKAPLNWWFQERALQRAHVIHALSTAEVEDIRRLKLANPIAVVPGGVTLNDSPAPPREKLEEQFPSLKNKRILLFSERLHPQKGLMHFLPAWKRARMAQQDWHFLIAGRDEDGHRAALESQAVALGIEDDVTFAGTLMGELQRAALHHAQAFVLPCSSSEGVSMSLLEALGARLPVVITPGCQFPEARRAGAAVETPATEAGFLDALQQLLVLSDEALRAMGERGRALVERDYRWDVAASQLKAVYAWCIATGPKPDCIVD